MKKLFDVRNIIILILLLLAILEFINPKGILPNRVVKITTVDSIPYPVHDTIPQEVEVEVEVPVEIEKPVPYEVHDTIPRIIDSLAIVKLFAETKQTKKDILQLPDNTGTVTVFDTISNNRVLGRSFTSKIKQKIVRDTIKIPEPRKNVLYFGLDGRLDKPNVVELLGASFILKTKDEKLYKVGVGVNNRVIDGTNGTFTPYIGGGIYWPIKLKKKKDGE